MLPVVDKPAIQYVVEHAVGADIRDILIITGRGKRTIEDHFDRSIELEFRLEQSGKYEELKLVREISDMASIHYIRQKDPQGLGAAVAMAESHVNGEPFAVLLGDDIIASGNLLRDMLSVYSRYGRSVIAVKEVPRADISLYGSIEPEMVEENLVRVVRIVEKPAPEDAPSNLAAIGYYVFTPEIFDSLRDTAPDAKGEVQLTDAINQLAQQQTVYAYIFEGVRYDIGKKLDYLRATVELAIEREDIGPEFRAILADLVQRKKLV
jgi:UTP--glucose-1-phosphate uridylyltransferase